MIFSRKKDNAPESSPQSGRLAIVAGSGPMALHIANSARRAGEDPVILMIENEADADFSAFTCHQFPIYAAGSLVEAARGEGVTRILFAGNFRRPDFDSIKIEWGTLKLVPKLVSQIMTLRQGGDDAVNNIIASAVQAVGFKLASPLDVAPDIVAKAKVYAGRKPGKADMADIAAGLNAVRTMGPLDIGQGVVVASQRIIAVEAAEGTDAMVRRCVDLRANGRFRGKTPSGILVKAAKPGQERRLDLPTIGAVTVASAIEARLSGIAIEAGSVLIPDLEDVVARAEEAGLFVIGVDNEPG